MTAEIDPYEALGHVAEGYRRAETREENDEDWCALVARGRIVERLDDGTADPYRTRLDRRASRPPARRVLRAVLVRGIDERLPLPPGTEVERARMPQRGSRVLIQAIQKRSGIFTRSPLR